MKIDGGKLEVNLFELFEDLSAEQLLEIADQLAITDQVIEAVADQIISGWTRGSSHGSKSLSADEPSTPLSRAIRAVALNAPCVAAKELEDMISAMRRQAAYNDQIRDWAWKMYHAMENPPAPPSAYDASPDKFVVVKKGE